jgi:hypothetical protein
MSALPRLSRQRAPPGTTGPPQALGPLDGTTFRNERTIDLASGQYTWNCSVSFDSGTVSTYWSDCYLYRVATGDSAWTTDLRVDARYGATFTWRSQLIRA